MNEYYQENYQKKRNQKNYEMERNQRNYQMELNQKIHENYGVCQSENWKEAFESHNFRGEIHGQEEEKYQEIMQVRLMCEKNQSCQKIQQNYNMETQKNKEIYLPQILQVQKLVLCQWKDQDTCILCNPKKSPKISKERNEDGVIEHDQRQYVDNKDTQIFLQGINPALFGINI